MCGINGIISKDKNKDKLIKSMNEKILHRGPDAEGIFVEGDVALGQRRLSIIDLAGGNQPIYNEDKSILIMYNGEVYNYKASDDNNDDKTEPEWGVKSFNLNKQTGNFNITVTAGKERYPDTKIYVALYRNGVLVSVKSFVPEFDSNSEYSGDGTMSLPSDMTNVSAKAFIWHGEMVPITEAIQLSIK